MPEKRSIRDVTPLRESRRLPVFLFTATFVTTTVAGAMQQGVHPLTDPLAVLRGLPFSITLMAILIVHEMSHYMASRFHGVRATLPFFIPAPSIIGTFGAVIQMRGTIWDRRTLFDIGASGPIGGFILALPALVAGFAMSQVAPGSGAEGGLILGDSLLVSMVGSLTLGKLPPDASVILHPVAFAGWIGMFVTSLNLLPVGQLDGGHISTALFPGRAGLIARVTHVGLVVLGVFFWEGWLFWALILFLIGVRHPPVLLPHIELDNRRRKVGFAAILIFFLTFVPVPFSVI
jgi:membrane-associated protease RseP (regulator of RpoE activity)